MRREWGQGGGLGTGQGEPRLPPGTASAPRPASCGTRPAELKRPCGSITPARVSGVTVATSSALKKGSLHPQSQSALCVLTAPAPSPKTEEQEGWA